MNSSEPVNMSGFWGVLCTEMDSEEKFLNIS